MNKMTAVAAVAALAVGVALGYFMHGGGGSGTDATGTGNVVWKARAEKAEKDGAQLRKRIGELEAQGALGAQPAETAVAEKKADGAVETIEIPKTPKEWGAYAGKMGKEWMAFRARWGETRPGPTDPKFAEYMAELQNLMANSAILRTQYEQYRDFNPNQKAEFGSSALSTMLDLDTGTTLAVHAKMLQHQAKLENVQRPPEDAPEEVRRAYYEQRREMTKEMMEQVKAVLPVDKAQQMDALPGGGLPGIGGFGGGDGRRWRGRGGPPRGGEGPPPGPPLP